MYAISQAVRLREEWLSDCAKERVLTENLLEEVVDISNLERVCKKAIARRFAEWPVSVGTCACGRDTESDRRRNQTTWSSRIAMEQV